MEVGRRRVEEEVGGPWNIPDCGGSAPGEGYPLRERE